MSLSDSVEGLKNFDVNDLDFNNAGSWPALVKLFVFLIVFSLILGGVYWFYVKDQYLALDTVVAKEVDLKKEYQDKAYKVANLDIYREQMNEMERTFGELLKQLPGDTEVPGLLEDITNTGLGSGLDISSITLKPEVSREFYVELPINIVALGTYHDLASFVSGVASLPRIVTLHDFSISPASGDTEMLTLNILAKTYRYKSGG
ncbi:MAG: pilus assembly protein PilP [Gammaproteobacteria bacterium]|nr:MAG: pilus assembly protein PilP [Pseudomonadota bacterium]PIE38714.1 MAG: pilus assembly protein PilP [Gammaproteobacteria bacterium]